MTAVNTELVLPDVDPEILASAGEDFQNIVADIQAGVLDTISWRDVALGIYPGNLLFAKTVSSRAKDGEASYPNFAFKLQLGDGMTTTAYYQLWHKNPNARRMRMQELMQTLTRLCGPEFKNVPAPDPSEPHSLKRMCEYLDALGRVAVQKSPKISARWADNSYNDATTGERVDSKKVVITRAA